MVLLRLENHVHRLLISWQKYTPGFFRCLIKLWLLFQWVDKEGKTPLIAACMNLELYYVAKTLIDLGANVNANHPGISIHQQISHLIFHFLSIYKF